MSRKLRTEFSQRASNYMNFIARNIDCVYLETEEEYGVREYLNSDSLIPIAVETRCDDVCSDYSAYANEQLFMLNATWYRFVIKLATSRYIESQLYKRIWTAILSDCFYGEIFVDKNKRIKHFFELDSISVVLNGFTHPIYDIEKYPVRRIKIKDSLFCITYSISRELSTVEMSEVVKQKLFRAFWEEVKDSNEYQEYIPLIAPSCFGLLAVFPNQIDLSYCRIKVSRSDTTFINSLLIPTWDYSCNIYSFMKDYTKRDLKDDCIKNIILSPKFLNVTKFIYDKKHSEDESADIEKIKTEYTKLLEELLDAYYDYILE